MRCCAVLFVLAFIGCIYAEQEIVHLPPEKVAQILPVAMQCVGESSVPPEVIFQYASGKSLGNDKKYQKFIHCVFTKTGYADETGHINIDKAMEVFPKGTDKEAVKKIMEECSKERGEDPPETSFKFAKCFRKKAPVRIAL
uniref:Odorant binding protein n=1 Tax=Chilo suppressalis TaxID=168631 RepID=M9YYA4_CHISP|nr:odorant-binding protein 1 [Chilo suppressalis]AGM38611.1 odorant binding protein [Chilo suppressalis]